MKRSLNIVSWMLKILNSNWIPRYMVIDEQGDITLFKAKKATDKRIKEALK